MSFTLVDSDGTGGQGASAATIATPGLTVNVGDLVVVLVKWEGANTTCSVSDGTNTLTEWSKGVVQNNGSQEPFFDVFYTLSSGVSGTNSVVYTNTFGAGQPFRSIAAMVFTPSAAASLDGTANANTGTTGTSATSGNLTTTGTDGIAFGCYAGYGASLSSETINGSIFANRIVVTGSDAEIFQTAYVAGFTGGAAATLSGSNRWDLGVIAFKIGAGGGSTPVTKLNIGRLRPAAFKSGLAR